MNAPRRLLDDPSALSPHERRALELGARLTPPSGQREAMWSAIAAGLPLPPAAPVPPASTASTSPSASTVSTAATTSTTATTATGQVPAAASATSSAGASATTSVGASGTTSVGASAAATKAVGVSLAKGATAITTSLAFKTVVMVSSSIAIVVAGYQATHRGLRDGAHGGAGAAMIQDNSAGSHAFDLVPPPLVSPGDQPSSNTMPGVPPAATTNVGTHDAHETGTTVDVNEASDPRSARIDPSPEPTSSKPLAGAPSTPSTATTAMPATAATNDGAHPGAIASDPSRQGSTTPPADAAPSIPHASSPSTEGAGAATGETPAKSDAQQESLLVSQARDAIRRGNGPLALTLLDQARVRFPRGILGQEREALSIEALAASGQQAAASARASAFIAAHPDSPYVARLRRYAP